VEVQVALLGPDSSGQGQAAVLRTIAASCVARDAAVEPARRPFRVVVLPTRISFEDAWAMRPAAAGPLWGLVGVGGDMLAGLGPDLAAGVPCFTVAGPAKSGRSTILLSMARSFLAGGTALILVTPRPSPLRSLEHAPGVAAVFSGRADLDEEELRAALSSVTGPAVVMIDDAELLRDCDASGELSAIIAFGGDSRRALVFAGDADSIGMGFGGWQVDAKRARRGCLTAPSTLPEGDLVGVRLTHGALGQPIRPGRCLLNVGNGSLITVTVPAE
jgi:S-DNA-T family DNA segregation ATPase FtsK/SpoIIIE